MIPSRAGILIVVTAAILCWSTGCASSQKTIRSRRDIDRLVTDYIRSLSTRALRGDFDTFLEKWADDLDHTVSLATMRTKGELRDFLSHWSEMFTNWKYVEARRMVEGNFVAWEGTASGIHRTTGKPIHLPLVMIMEFNPDGKVRMSHVYFDTGVLQRQLLTEP